VPILIVYFGKKSCSSCQKYNFAKMSSKTDDSTAVQTRRFSRNSNTSKSGQNTRELSVNRTVFNPTMTTTILTTNLCEKCLKRAAKLVHRALGISSNALTVLRRRRRQSLLEGSARQTRRKKPKGVWPPFKVKTSARTPNENN